MKSVYTLVTISAVISVALGSLWLATDKTRVKSGQLNSEVGEWGKESEIVNSELVNLSSPRLLQASSEAGGSERRPKAGPPMAEMVVNRLEKEDSITTRDITTPAGRVKTIVPDILNGEGNLIDLSNEDFEYLAIRWQGEAFKYTLAASDQLPAVSEIKAVQEDDLASEESSVSVSELLTANDDKYLYIYPADTTENIEIDMISTKVEEGQTATVSAAPSNYSSGPKYSSLGIIPREQWSGNADINDPRVAGICELFDDSDPGNDPPYPRPTWCDSDIENSLLTWEPYYYSVEKVVIHHTYPNENNYHDPAEQVRGIYNYHAHSYGWGDIGYNYLIDWRGNIYEGKLGGEEAKGYHASSGNYNSIGIAIIGTYTDVVPTQAAQDALVRLIAEKAAFYDFTPTWQSTVFGHRDFQSTACPGNAFYNILPNISSRASSYKNNHFSTIKNVVALVNQGIDGDNYEAFDLILKYDTAATIDDITSVFPAYNNEIVQFNGLESYTISEEYVTLRFDYSLYAYQETKERLRTLYKVLWLRGDVEAAGLNFRYSVH